MKFETQETERLRLRMLQPQDAEAVFAYRSMPEISRYQGWQPASVEAVKTFIEALNEDQFLENDQWTQLGIESKKNHTLLGDIGLHSPVDDAPKKQAELGITLKHSAQGHGFAQEAFKEIISYLFATQQVHRIHCSIDPRNHPSLRLVERLGFRKEGHMKQSLWFKGEWADDVIYALLRSDW